MPLTPVMERFSIMKESDVGISVVGVQAYARAQGLSDAGIARLSTAVCELARNIVKYCPDSGGDVIIHAEPSGPTVRLVVQVRDNGPGIADVDQALRDHYSSSGTLGLGLPGVKRIVDEFTILSVPGSGTVVTITVNR